MKSLVTARIAGLTDKIVQGSTSARDKALAIWKHVRAMPYDVFGITKDDVDALASSPDPLTCYGKSLVQSSMLESAGIPWRFELSNCPSTAVEHTVRAMTGSNPLVVKLFDNFRSLFAGQSLMHSAVEANIDGTWTRMDSTIPEDVCKRMADPAKREKCLSLDNVTAVHECKTIGHDVSLPRQVVGAWNAVSAAGKWANALFKK
jgi:transglutaminase-like putative cysteine protease